MKCFVAGMLMTGIVGGMGSAPVAGQVPSGAAFGRDTWGPPVAPWRKSLDHDLLQRPLNPSGLGMEPVLPGGTVKPWADGSMDRDLLFRAGEDKSRVMHVVPAALSPSATSACVSALDPAALNHPVFQGPVEDRFSVLAHAPWWLRVEAATLESAPVPGRGEISLLVCDGFRVPTREEVRAARIQAALRDAALRQSRSLLRSPRPGGTASPP